MSTERSRTLAIELEFRARKIHENAIIACHLIYQDKDRHLVESMLRDAEKDAEKALDGIRALRTDLATQAVAL